MALLRAVLVDRRADFDRRSDAYLETLVDVILAAAMSSYARSRVVQR